METQSKTLYDKLIGQFGEDTMTTAFNKNRPRAERRSALRKIHGQFKKEVKKDQETTAKQSVTKVKLSRADKSWLKRQKEAREAALLEKNLSVYSGMNYDEFNAIEAGDR